MVKVVSEMVSPVNGLAGTGESKYRLQFRYNTKTWTVTTEHYWFMHEQNLLKLNAGSAVMLTELLSPAYYYVINQL